MRTFNGLQIFTTQLTNSGQLDARYIIRNDVLGPQGQADFGTQSSIRALSVGGVIAGGSANVITGDFASIGGGQNNIADVYAFVGGGADNQAIDQYVVIGGGWNNIAGSAFNLIGAGCCNFITIRPKTGPGSRNAPSYQSSIINGANNTIDGSWSFIGGGLENLITGGGIFSLNNILGGWCNSICNSTMSTILGGRMNAISGQNLSEATPDFIGGGCLNKAYNHGNFIGGGKNNTTNCYGTILNGSDNTICDSYASIILGGASNLINGNNEGDTPNFIGGGFGNEACNGGNFIGGGQNNRANCCGTILNGSANCASCYSVIIGGALNIASYDSFIGAGVENTAAGQVSFIGHGDGNTADGMYSFIGNGYSNSALADYSYIVGGACAIIDSDHIGAAILGDGQFREHNSSGPHTLTLDFSSGTYIKNKVIIQGYYNIPSTPNSFGISGETAYDNNYHYRHNGTNWTRTAMSTW
jgi:hypothetical protein